MSEAWAYRPADTNYKSARRLARYLVETVARGGNLLLNVGPMGDGAVPDTEVALLRELGGWIDTHGESVIGVEPVGGAVDFYGPVTRRGERVYLHLLLRPVEEVVVRGVPVRRIRAVTLLGSGTSLGYETNVEVHEEDHLGREALGELIIRAPEATDALIDVIAIDLEGEG
jgi:alpha-L-fucosidase